MDGEDGSGGNEGGEIYKRGKKEVEAWLQHI